MSNCPKCGTTFKFTDLVSGINPGNIKCSGCDGRIKSSNLIAIPTLILAVIVAIPLLFAPMPLSWLMRVAILAGIAVAVDYLYYVLLNKGIIKSNLVIEKDPTKS